MYCNLIAGEKEVQVWTVTDKGSFIECLNEFETVQEAIDWVLGRLPKPTVANQWVNQYECGNCPHSWVSIVDNDLEEDENCEKCLEAASPTGCMAIFNHVSVPS